jgi:cytochrome c
LQRELCGKADKSKNGGTTLLLALALIAILLAIVASAQGLRKDLRTKPAATASAAQQAVSGRELFHRHCASCHFTDTTAQKIGPGLKGLYPRLTFSDGKKVTDASLSRWIEAGGKNMPGFKESMKPEQIRELVSYIRTL